MGGEPCGGGAVGCAARLGRAHAGVHCQHEDGSSQRPLCFSSYRYDIKFGQDVPPTKLCSQTLDRETSLIFSSAVEVHYW